MSSLEINKISYVEIKCVMESYIKTKIKRDASVLQEKKEGCFFVFTELLILVVTWWSFKV